jgi:FG-GAP repeat
MGVRLDKRGAKMRRSLLVLVLVAVSTIGWSPARALASGASGAAPTSPRVQADFNGDGDDDIAVGVPGESVGSIISAGAVNVLFGSGGGLSGAGSQLFHQDVAGIGSAAEEFDSFGAALAVGDFNGDGFDDLAVGVPGESVGTVEAAGAVNVLFGTAGGLTGAGSQLFHQDVAGIGSTAEVFDFFGSALAAGDLDGDGVDDLAVGVPDENVGTVEVAGAVNLLYGSPTGLNGGRASALFHQDVAGIGSSAQPFDLFGAALAIGDFNDSGVSDLAVGAPGEAVGTVDAAGAAHVLFGRTTGVSGASSQLFHQGLAGVGSDPEVGDFFGAALGAGDFDDDGFADLAIGADGESVGAIPGAGAINVLYGAVGGLTVTGSQVLHQGVSGVGSNPEDFDGFGFALVAGDFDNDGPVDLAVGVPFEGVGAVPGAGAINVLFGGGGGLSGSGSQLFHQDVAGVGSTAEDFDNFGWSLAVGDVQGDGPADLVVGVPFESVGAVPGAGAINAFSGGGAGLTGGAVLHQDFAGIGSTAEEFDVFGLAVGGPDPQGASVAATSAASSHGAAATSAASASGAAATSVTAAGAAGRSLGR